MDGATVQQQMYSCTSPNVQKNSFNNGSTTVVAVAVGVIIESVFPAKCTHIRMSLETSCAKIALRSPSPSLYCGCPCSLSGKCCTVRQSTKIITTAKHKKVIWTHMAKKVVGVSTRSECAQKCELSSSVDKSETNPQMPPSYAHPPTPYTPSHHHTITHTHTHTSHTVLESRAFVRITNLVVK